MTCEHTHVYMLGSGPVLIRYCRFEDCGEWSIDVEDVGALLGHPLAQTRWTGTGPEQYRDAAEQVARMLPGWEEAAFVFGLGGHAHEVDITWPPPPRPDQDDTVPF